MTTSSHEINLRPGEPADIDAIAAVLDRAWRTAYREILEPSVFESSSVANWRAQLVDGNPLLQTLVATDQSSSIVGFTRFGPKASNAEPHSAYLASLYVDPGAGGQGVGTKLLRATVDLLASEGYLSLTLWVFRDNLGARRLYERFGFEFDGTEFVDPRWRVPQLQYRRQLSASHANVAGAVAGGPRAN